MLARGVMFRGAVAQARCCRVTPALRVVAPMRRTLHASAQLRGPEHDDFAPVSKVVPDTDILEQIGQVRAISRQRCPSNSAGDSVARRSGSLS
jgi:hypothetical protein